MQKFVEILIFQLHVKTDNMRKTPDAVNIGREGYRRRKEGRATGREEGKEGELENERESPCPLSNSHIYVDDTECPKSSKSHVFFLCGFYFVSLEWLKLYGVQIS